MGIRFVAETDYHETIKIDPESASATVRGLIENPDAAVFVSGNGTLTGMIGMLAYSHPFSGERAAFELFWWVDPEARGDGIRLLRAAEGWAREQGIHKMQMIAPTERVGVLYKRLGYKHVECAFQRSL